MKAFFYSVINVETKERWSCGCYEKNARKKLEELQQANPNGKYKIVYKWGAI